MSHEFQPSPSGSPSASPVPKGARKPPDDAATRNWFLVHTKPRQEEVALLNLERQGYPCYLPRIRMERIRRGKAQIVEEALFPRYLFVHLDTSGQGLSWAPIRSTLGVSRLVHFGTQPARVDDALVRWLQAREQAMPAEHLFQEGDRVRVTQGPFVGLEAIYLARDAEQRSMILLEILSKPVVLPIETAALARPANH